MFAKEDYFPFTRGDMARGMHISRWHNWSTEGCIGLAVDAWEYHTDGSPALRELWGKWSIKQSVSTKRAMRLLGDLIDSLYQRRHGCCSKPEGDGDEIDDDQPEWPSCRQCSSLEIAARSAVAILQMMHGLPLEDIQRYVHFVKEAHMRFEGARDGFGKPGRYKGITAPPPIP